MARKACLVAAVATALALALRAHLAFVTPQPLPMHSFDEGYLAAAAMRLLDGHMLPYVDAADQRGPLLQWVPALLMRLSTPFSWWPLRLAALICSTGVAAALFGAGILARRWLAGALAAVGYLGATLILVGPGDGLAYNGEPLLNLCAGAALVCLVRALANPERPPAPAWLAAAGALATMSALAKQPGLVNLVILGAWVAIAARARPQLTRRQRVALVGAFVAGASLPLVLLLLRYAVAGELHTLYYWAIVRPQVYLAPYTPALRHAAHLRWLADNGGTLLGLALLAGGALAWPLVRARRDGIGVARAYDRHGLLVTAALGAPLAMLAAHAALREFPHYYVQAYFWNALLVGLAVEELLLLVPGRRYDALACAALLVPALLLIGVRLETRQVPRYDHRDRSRTGLCDFVRAHSQPDDHLFIWGYRPEFYVACARRPASRFVYTTAVAGYVEWFDGSSRAQEERWAAPGSRAQLISDLQETKPPVLIDYGISIARKLDRYPELWQYVQREYCPQWHDHDVDYYLRRRPDHGCP
jgi:hypothetical protein